MTKAITLTELKKNLSDIVNQASYGKEQFILLSHGKERAAIISMEDLYLLSELKDKLSDQQYQNQQYALLQDAQTLRESIRDAGYSADSAKTVEDVREERTDDLSGLR